MLLYIFFRLKMVQKFEVEGYEAFKTKVEELSQVKGF